MRYELGCPRCGAPINLEETEHIIDCPYCRVRHIIATSGHLACRIPPRAEEPSKNTVYVPYWHFRGLVFAMHGPEVRHRILDISSLAVPVRELPYSLGMRTQTQPLHFIHPETEAFFLPPRLKKHSLLRRVASRTLGLGPKLDPPPLQSHIGDLILLVYFPLLINGDKAFDGLTGRAVPDLSGPSLASGATKYPGPLPRFLPALCPHCGWDLSGDDSSLLQYCKNCQRMWTSLKERLIPIEFKLAGESAPGTELLPFWEIEVGNSEMDLSSRDELIRLANLPRPGGNNGRLRFLLPGFKLNPALFLRLARQATVFEFPETGGKKLWPEDLLPCSLPLSEAFEAIVPVLYDLARDKEMMRSVLARSKFTMRGCRAVFLPFTQMGSEMVQPDMNVAVPAAAVHFGQNL